MTEQSIKVQDLETALKILKGVRKVSREILSDVQSLKENASPYKVGETVTIWWAGWEREGIVVDPLVNYNHALSFTAENCEPACVIRFEGDIEGHNGQNLGIHEVVPHRQIK